MSRVSYIKLCGLPSKNKAKLPRIPTKINRKNHNNCSTSSINFSACKISSSANSSEKTTE